MSDNFAFLDGNKVLKTAGSKEISSIHYPAHVEFDDAGNVFKGQKTMDNSKPVVIASNQSAVPISDGGGSITIDGTVTVNEPVSVDDNGGSLTVDGTVTVQDGGGSLTTDSAQLPATLGQKTMAASLAVVIASNQSAVPTADAALTTLLSRTPETVYGDNADAVASTWFKYDGPLADSVGASAAVISPAMDFTAWTGGTPTKNFYFFMEGYTRLVFMVKNGFNVSITLNPKAYFSDLSLRQEGINLDEIVLAAGESAFFGEGAAGSGGSAFYNELPAMNSGWAYFGVKVVAASAPASGGLTIFATRNRW